MSTTTKDCPSSRKESTIPKFYVESGPVRLIFDASTAEQAAVMAFQWTCDKQAEIDGWTGGGPAKLSRATSIVSPNWSQAMIAHVWSSGEALTLDPATGVRGDRVVTSRYNDFANLRWLGNRPASQFSFRVRQSSDTGQMSEWSPWHQAVRTADESVKPEGSEGQMRRPDAATVIVLLTAGLVAGEVRMYSAAAQDRAPREIFLSETRLATLKRRVEKRIEPTYAAWLDYRDAADHSQAKQGLQDDANAVYELVLCCARATGPELDRRWEPDFRWKTQGIEEVFPVANRRLGSSVLTTE